MDEQHRGSNPGSSEASKRPLSASAQKESQNEHAQKTKVSAAMASVEPQALFGGTPAGSVHAPPMEAALTTTSNEKGGPLRPPVRHPKTIPLSSLLRSALRFTPLLLMVPPWFLHCSKIPPRRVLRDRLRIPQNISNLLNSELRNRPLLEKVPPWNSPRKKTKQKMCGHQTTITKSTAMAPLTTGRLLFSCSICKQVSKEGGDS